MHSRHHDGLEQVDVGAEREVHRLLAGAEGDLTRPGLVPDGAHPQRHDLPADASGRYQDRVPAVVAGENADVQLRDLDGRDRQRLAPVVDDSATNDRILRQRRAREREPSAREQRHPKPILTTW